MAAAAKVEAGNGGVGSAKKREAARVQYNVEQNPTDAYNELSAALKQLSSSGSVGATPYVPARQVASPRPPFNAIAVGPQKPVVSVVFGGSEVSPGEKAAVNRIRKSYPGLDVRVSLSTPNRAYVFDQDGFPRLANRASDWVNFAGMPTSAFVPKK